MTEAEAQLWHMPDGRTALLITRGDPPGNRNERAREWLAERRVYIHEYGHPTEQSYCIVRRLKADWCSILMTNGEWHGPGETRRIELYTKALIVAILALGEEKQE